MAYIDDKMGRGEKIIYKGHQHVMVLVLQALKWIGLFIVAFVAAILVGLNWKPAGGDWQNSAKTIILVALVVVALVAFVRMFWDYLQWYNDELYVTNERIIKIVGVVNKDMDDSSLDKINDIELKQTVPGRMFNYGTLRIFTGNDSAANVFNFLAKPNEFKRVMLDAKNGIYGDALDIVRAQQQQQSQQVRPPVQGMPQPKGPMPGQAYPPQQQQPGYGQQPYQGGYPSQAQAPQGGAPNPNDIPVLIERLARLRDAGAITEAEFQAKKNDLLSRM